MKKILAIFLALIMILSVTLVACQKDTAKTSGGSADDEEDDLFVSQSSKDTSKDTSDDDKKTGGWEAAAYPIYCMANGLNVRSSNSTSSESLGKLNIGDKVDAVERNDDWYKITYNNGTAYVSRDFVTAIANEATFTRLETPEKLNVVEAKKDTQVVLRKYPVIADDSYGPVFKGTDAVATLTKVGENADKNWFIVSYDADGEGAGAAVEYYLSVGSAARELFGLSGNSGNGVG